MRPEVDSRAGKVAEDDYNDGADCKRRAGTSTAIEDMDWSSMTEDYVCFTEDFDADAEILELCDDVVSDAAGIGGDDKDSDDNSLVVILCVVIGALLVVIAILVMMKRRKPEKPPSESAPPVAAVVHEPTAPPLASIKAEALEMMAEETAELAPEAASLPPGHVSGAEAAAMTKGEPPPQESVGWGRRSLQRLASWWAVEEPPPPPAAEGAYAPEAELQPEC